MKTLHIINKTDDHALVWNPCLAALREGDTLLLIENATSLAVSLNDKDSILSDVPSGVTIRFLLPDLDARGLTPLVNEQQRATDAEFVSLCLEHDNNISWF
jgi:sulfur relay protein TusB/DsrH